MTTAGFFSKNDRDDLESLLHAIERDHVSKKHPDSVSRRIERLGVIVTQRRLKPLRRVVTDITDRAAGERHETRPVRERAPAEIISNPFSRDFQIRFGLAVALDNRLQSLATHDHLRLGAEERVARDSFTTFNRLEQE